MPIVTLTFTGSDEEISDGIPRTMTIESNVPATIYFTLDGSTPTIDSPIYVDTFEMPDGETSVILSAFGVDAENVAGPILVQTYAADVSRMSVSRMTGIEGFIIARDFAEPDYPDDVYDADGYIARYLDIPPDRLDYTPSDRGFEGIAEGTRIEVGFPDPDLTPSLIDDDMVPVTTPEVGELFHPNAKVTYIDNRIENDILLILRPFGSLHNPYREFGGKRVREVADDATYVSGGFVRRFYDTKNNIMVSYYFDHNECRYVRNIQDLPDDIKNTNNIGIQPSAGRPLVFQWIYRGRQSSI